MPNLLRGTILVLLFITIFIPASALDENFSDFEISQPPIMEQDESDDAIVRVIPGEAIVGNQHVVLVTGLVAGEAATIRIIFEDDDTVVYESQETANTRGIIEVEIFTESGDTPGAYRVEVTNNSGLVIGMDSLTITAPEDFSNVITVTPLEAEAGASFTIDISDTRPFAVLEVFIKNESDEEIFTQRLRSTVDGNATITFESSEATSGTLTITIVEDEVREISSQEITVSGQVFPATVVIEPSAALPGETVFVTISSLTPEEAVIVEIILNDVIVMTIEETANINGLVVFTYDFAIDDSRGIYDFRILQNDEQVAFQTLTVDILPVTIEVTPAIGTIGTVFVATISDLRADEEVLVEFIRDAEIIQTQTSRADADGIARASLGQRLDLEIASYDVRVLRMGEEIVTRTVEVAEERPPTPADIIATIEPQSAPIPSIYTLTVDGLAADTVLDIAILFNGEAVASFPGTVDENGSYSTEIGTDENDVTGIYTLEISADGEVIATVDLEATDAIAESADDEDTTDETDDTPAADEEVTDEDEQTEAIVSGDVSLNINPGLLLRGERIEFIAGNLEPGENVTFELWFEGTMIYSAERTADATGATGVALVAQEDEAFGNYEMRVLRDGEIIASNTFQIVESEAEIATAQISVDPQNGVRGTEYIITVSGLEATEEVEIIVSFADEPVFETARTANNDGTITVRVNSDETDEIGTYDVIIIRENANNLEASFTIEEGELEIIEDDEPLATEANLNVDPLTGTIGTNHTVSVTGLEPDEEFALTIEFNGESVYNVARTADDEGNFNTTISTAESDSPGEYDIIIERSDADDLSLTIRIVADEDALESGDETTSGDGSAINVEPESGAIGTNYEFVISGLESNEEFDVLVEFDGESVFESKRTADASGFSTIELNTDESDSPGIYTLTVLRDGEAIVSVEFEVEGSDSPVDEDDMDDEIIDADSTDNEVIVTDDDIDTVVYADAVSIEFDADTSLQIVEFEGQSGDVIDVTVNSDNSLDTVATLISPDGTIISSDDDGGQGFDPEIERAVLPDTGIYTLEIRSFNAGDSGTATVTINRNDGRSLVDVETRTITLNSKITEDVLTFFGRPGDPISLEISLESGTIGDLHITAEQQGAILMTYQTSGLVQPIILGFVVPETGTVIIRLESDGTGNATLNMSIESN